MAAGAVLEVEAVDGDSQSADAVVEPADEVAAVEAGRVTARIARALQLKLPERVQAVAARLPLRVRRLPRRLEPRLEQARGLRWNGSVRDAWREA